MLDFDWVTIIWEVVNFIVITIILYFLVFKPIVKRSEARAREKARLMAELVRDQEEAAAKLEEINARMANLDNEIQQITNEAYEQNKILQAKLLEGTREEASQILQKAIHEAHQEQFINTKKYHNELTDSVLRVTGDTLKRVIPPSVHADLVNDLVKYILDLGKNQMPQVQAIRDALSDRLPQAFMTSAIALTSEQELKLVRTFNALVDKEVNVDINIDGSLIAGLKVRIGDVILENSLAAQLEQIRAEISESLEMETHSHEA